VTPPPAAQAAEKQRKTLFEPHRVTDAARSSGSRRRQWRALHTFSGENV
jgi:hypothetical protein